MKDDRSNKRPTRAMHLAACVALVLGAAGHVQAGVIASDNFESYSWGATTLNPAIWAAANNGVVWDGSQSSGSTPYVQDNNDYSSFFPTGNALFFQNSGNRDATTVAFDLALGGAISFDLSLGATSPPRYDGPFETQDANENVRLLYSIDSGANWSTLYQFDLNDPEYTMENRWSNFEHIIAVGDAAATSATMFRIEQAIHSGSSFDNWAFDTFQVFANEPAPELIPEPSSIALMTLGGAFMALGAYRHRRRETKESDGQAAAV